MRSHAISEVWVLLSIDALHPAGALFFLNSAGMILERGSGALVWALDAASLGTHRIVVDVEDGNGGSDRANYLIEIRDERPLIVSTPATRVAAGETYAYQPIAFDPTPVDTLGYTIAEGPTGMSIDPDDGRLSWLTDEDDIGSHSVQITVADTDGHSAEQSFVIEVRDSASGTVAPLVVTSAPLLDATLSASYDYAIVAGGVSNALLDYTLVTGAGRDDALL